jgi:hypothetical protein
MYIKVKGQLWFPTVMDSPWALALHIAAPHRTSLDVMAPTHCRVVVYRDYQLPPAVHH